MILHVDMDAFYASVEQRDAPELVGKPVVVGGSPEGRGVIAAASYEARKFGIHSAMPAAKAVRLCSSAVFLKPRIGYYAEVSQQIREIFERYTPLVEPLSLDEAFLDVGASAALFGAAEQIAAEIKSTIRSELRLTASVGVAVNKFLAKIASDLDKPNGLRVVPPGTELEFLTALPISRLWGVGEIGGAKFRELGANTIGDVRRFSEAELSHHFGPSGVRYFSLCRGIDSRPVEANRVVKSVSHETTFPEDITSVDELRSCLLHLTELVATRLRHKGLKGRVVQLKLRWHTFETISREATLAAPTYETQALWQAASALFEKVSLAGRRVRLLGMGVSGLAGSEMGTGLTQKLLFNDPDSERQAAVDDVADAVRAKFGKNSLVRGRVPKAPDRG